MDRCILDLLTRKMDKDTVKHCFNTHMLALEFERENDLDTTLLSEAAAIHDIGKMYIDKNILEKGKDEKLTPLEKKIVYLHPYFGYEILGDYGVDEDIRKIILYHHGKNPPCIQGAEIPPLDNETAIYANFLYGLDVYAALIDNRPYRAAMPKNVAIDVMEKDGRHNPMIIEFLKNK